MKYFLIISISLFAFFSCKKEAKQEPTPPPVTGEKITVHFQLGGDITTSVGDLRVGGNSIAAKTAFDSTIYAVNIRTAAGALFAQGLFDNPDSIRLDILKDSSYIVNVAAIKKGSSYGLWWQMVGGYKQYPFPIHRTLRNRMFYAAEEAAGSAEAMQPAFADSMAYFSVIRDSLTMAVDVFPISEVNAYFGSTNYTARDTNNTDINLVLRRLVFAIQYKVFNLRQGYLEATYGGQMRPDTLKIKDSLPVARVYSADLFRSKDSIPGSQLQVTLTWVKGDGSKEVLGTKPIRPKRNSLTAISVYLDIKNVDGTIGVNLGDTTWTNVNINY
ncbi:hypothetical protein [Chitinophaga sancti]|uniref:Fimbrillin-A associated anchor protein Mfa1 and Mfa2 n=1 Tax=Chitinophaga sancti TaxID=1004 RepID=A0A1K1SL04_9BACT|nr:hypothetical protein [Chitinophaga sancti]WQD65477.1 hypothetical protein U0033_13840 [Chitinophaga sancti]WQG88900.1 hypothetical protein SR876_28630 [Chitinophaga sancti]SFW84860.1 hypothetical protein SAMN05661012_05612 [Chitinophaga sancti]